LKESTKVPISSPEVLGMAKSRLPLIIFWVPSTSFWTGSVIPLARKRPKVVAEKMIRRVTRERVIR